MLTKGDQIRVHTIDYRQKLENNDFPYHSNVDYKKKFEPNIWGSMLPVLIQIHLDSDLESDSRCPDMHSTGQIYSQSTSTLNTETKRLNQGKRRSAPKNNEKKFKWLTHSIEKQCPWGDRIMHQCLGSYSLHNASHNNALSISQFKKTRPWVVWAYSSYANV